MCQNQTFTIKSKLCTLLLNLRYKKADAHGLYLYITPNVSKYWRLKYRFVSKEKVLALFLRSIETSFFVRRFTPYFVFRKRLLVDFLGVDFY